MAVVALLLLGGGWCTAFPQPKLQTQETTTTTLTLTRPYTIYSDIHFATHTDHSRSKKKKINATQYAICNIHNSNDLGKSITISVYTDVASPCPSLRGRPQKQKTKRGGGGRGGERQQQQQDNFRTRTRDREIDVYMCCVLYVRVAPCRAHLFLCMCIRVESSSLNQYIQHAHNMTHNPHKATYRYGQGEGVSLALKCVRVWRVYVCFRS